MRPVLTGPLTVEGVLGAVTSAVGRELRFRGEFEGVIAQAVGFVARTDGPWSDRLAILRQHVLGSVPLLVVLDNFRGQPRHARSGRGRARSDPRRYQQSLQINERLGNQAGMASSYHQLGILAQLRGDYDEAEARYQQALQINERLGNQADMAGSYSQLGILAADRGDLAGAVVLHGRALAIRLQLRVPQLAIDARRLGDHRAMLGDDAFRQALTAGMGEETAAAMIALLDDVARNQAEAETERPGESGAG